MVHSDRPALEIEITPEMVAAGVNAVTMLERGDWELMDWSQRVETILLASLDLEVKPARRPI